MPNPIYLELSVSSLPILNVILRLLTMPFSKSATPLTSDCQSIKWQPQYASYCQRQKVAAAYVLFSANGTNIVANWVKEQHKIDENSSIVFKWQTLAKESTI